MKKEKLSINDLAPEVVESMREEIRASKEYQSLFIKKINLLKQRRYMEAMNLSKAMEEVETLAIKEYLRHYEGEVRKVSELTASMTEEDREMMSAYGNSLVMLADVMETMCIECNQLIQKYHPSFRIEMFDKLTKLGKEAKKHVRMLDNYSTDDFYTSAYGDATTSCVKWRSTKQRDSSEKSRNMRKALIRKLHDIQKWRRGGKGTMPFSPKVFGEAIDDCIRILRKLGDEQVNNILDESRRTDNRKQRSV